MSDWRKNECPAGERPAFDGDPIIICQMSFDGRYMMDRASSFWFGPASPNVPTRFREATPEEVETFEGYQETRAAADRAFIEWLARRGEEPPAAA